MEYYQNYENYKIPSYRVGVKKCPDDVYDGREKMLLGLEAPYYN